VPADLQCADNQFIVEKTCQTQEKTGAGRGQSTGVNPMQVANGGK
jgi:hypothetical protein